MNKSFKKTLLVIGAVLIWVVLYAIYQYAHRSEVAKKSQLVSLLDGTQVSLQIPEPTKFSGCQIQDHLPDPGCTPGAIFENVSLDQMCTPGYTKTVRNVSLKTRKKVYAMYAIDYPPPTGSYELDHFIPLALGGNNDIANLFPESAYPFPGFKEKDVVEIYLYQEVCAGRIAIKVAQSQIAKDWVMIYSNLSSETIKAIKNKYKSWSN